MVKLMSLKSFHRILKPDLDLSHGSRLQDLEENTRKVPGTRHEESTTVSASESTQIHNSFAKEKPKYPSELTIVQLDVDRNFYAIRDQQGRTLGTGGREVCEVLIQILRKQPSVAVSR